MSIGRSFGVRGETHHPFPPAPPRPPSVRGRIAAAALVLGVVAVGAASPPAALADGLGDAGTSAAPVAGTPAPNDPAAAAVGEGAARDLLRAINAARVANGLGTLVRVPQLDASATAWSLVQQRDGRLSHRPDLDAVVSRSVPGWRGFGENVGVAPSVRAVFDAFVRSPAHQKNQLGDWDRVGIGTATASDGSVWVTVDFVKGAEAPSVSGPGYWAASADGRVAAEGGAAGLGDLAGLALNKPIVGASPTTSGNGYWLVASDGGIFSFGDATFFGSTGAMRLNRPIVGMASAPSGRGYWLVASDGGIFSFGGATFFGSTGAMRLNQPIVGMASTPSGRGYWLVASDGGIFAFGDAPFLGSTGSQKLPAPVVGIATLPGGTGYWLALADGSVRSFGSAPALDELAGVFPTQRIAPLADGSGYRLVSTDGRIATVTAQGVTVTGRIVVGAPIVAVANARS